MDDELTIKIKEIIRKEVPEILRGSAFTVKKVTDTPNDSLSLVNRNYVNLSGSVASRPSSSVAQMGQRYFAIDTGIPMVYNRSSSVWANGAGSTVAQG